ncbi:Serine protease inhibitor- potato inhibitor I-type family protein [Striga hermonthica]|uniref:Serine protease inhibitor- potato inhibitor I-type family protein n=1 Tax=Striga hermonthica TaxID=68872 RepID=A0A9N7MHD9_STRHE|nr:Serine protease inhibitor- potato inhibitor I-type family protein [Striga hermonthica]
MGDHPYWRRYPPCESALCPDLLCCSFNHKYKVTWPELVGAEPEKAKAIIERENPYVTAVILYRGAKTILDFCCNRVWIHQDANNRVEYVPKVG